MSTLSLEEVFAEAARLGVRIELASGGVIEVSPADLVTEELVAEIRARRAEVRALLEATAPWLHVSKQVLLAEFDGCDFATRKRLVANA